MAEPSLFVATPLHSSWLHHGYVAGALQAMTSFAGRIAFEVQTGSILPRNRDILTTRFLDSGASHMLCVDSDIGWHPEHAELLIASGKDFVSGCYPKKQPNREIPARLTGRRDGQLWEAEHVPAGFLLLSRRVIERMISAYGELVYRTGVHRCWALWAPLFEPGLSYDGEDVAFCRRWRRLGGEIWLHQGVVLKHHGEFCFELPKEEDYAAPDWQESEGHILEHPDAPARGVSAAAGPGDRDAQGRQAEAAETEALSDRRRRYPERAEGARP